MKSPTQKTKKKNGTTILFQEGFENTPFSEKIKKIRNNDKTSPQIDHHGWCRHGGLVDVVDNVPVDVFLVDLIASPATRTTSTTSTRSPYPIYCPKYWP